MFKKANLRKSYAITGAVMAAAAASMLNAPDLLALTPPAVGAVDPGAELYQVIANVINSPIMTVVGVSAIMAGAAMAWMNKMLSAIPVVIGGAAIANADTLVAVMGATF